MTAPKAAYLWSAVDIADARVAVHEALLRIDECREDDAAIRANTLEALTRSYANLCRCVPRYP